MSIKNCDVALILVIMVILIHSYDILLGRTISTKFEKIILFNRSLKKKSFGKNIKKSSISDKILNFEFVKSTYMF